MSSITNKFASAAALGVLALGLSAAVNAADSDIRNSVIGSTSTTNPMDNPSSSAAAADKNQYSFSARLINEEANAQRQQATVQVKVSGFDIVDPALVNERPHVGQGHLHYRVDNGPEIATTSTKLSFHKLTPGSHTITVMLASNDHSAVGPQQVLTVTIPSTATEQGM